MYVRGYLRASTAEQNAQRARADLERFAAEHGRDVVSWYIENVSGASTQRPELLRLINDAKPGDILLIESVDRLSRLAAPEWRQLRGQIDTLGLRVVSLDLPTSYAAMATAVGSEDFTGRMLDALNTMMLDVLAAVARKDYDDRRARQRQGIENAQKEGKYQGKQPNKELHARVNALIDAKAANGKGFSIAKIAELAGCSATTVKQIKRDRREREAAAASKSTGTALTHSTL